MVGAREGGRGDRVRLLGALREDGSQLPGVAAQLAVAEPDRVEELDHGLCHLLLEPPVACAVVARLDRVRGLVRGDGHDLDQVRDAGLVLGPHDVAPGVGDGGADLPPDHVRWVEHLDEAEFGGERGRHAARGILEVHDLRAELAVRPLGYDERLAEALVEPLREVAGELEVLALVFPDRHDVGVVEEDVGRLQHRVGHQPDREARLRRRLLPELRHAPELPVGSHALHHPCQARVLGYVALDEERADVRIEAAGDQERGQVERRLAQLVGLLGNRDRVQVDERVERIHLVLLRHPAADGAGVVAEVLLARRLDPRENAHVAPIIPH